MTTPQTEKVSTPGPAMTSLPQLITQDEALSSPMVAESRCSRLQIDCDQTWSPAHENGLSPTTTITRWTQMPRGGHFPALEESRASVPSGWTRFSWSARGDGGYQNRSSPEPAAQGRHACPEARTPSRSMSTRSSATYARRSSRRRRRPRRRATRRPRSRTTGDAISRHVTPWAAAQATTESGHRREGPQIH
jgi:hypothetical protein